MEKDNLNVDGGIAAQSGNSFASQPVKVFVAGLKINIDFNSNVDKFKNSNKCTRGECEHSTEAGLLQPHALTSVHNFIFFVLTLFRWICFFSGRLVLNSAICCAFHGWSTSSSPLIVVDDTSIIQYIYSNVVLSARARVSFSCLPLFLLSMLAVLNWIWKKKKERWPLWLRPARLLLHVCAR